MNNIAKIIVISFAFLSQPSWGMKKIKKAFTTHDKNITPESTQTINRLTRTRADLDTISTLRDKPDKITQENLRIPGYENDVDAIIKEQDPDKKARALEELQTKIQAKELQDRQVLENQVGKNAIDRLTKSQDRLTLGERVALLKNAPNSISSKKKQTEFKKLQDEFNQDNATPEQQAAAAQKLGKFIQSLPKKDQEAIKTKATEEFLKNPTVKSLSKEQQKAALDLFTKSINSKDFKNSYAYRQKEWLTLGFVPAVILSLIMAVVGFYISKELSKEDEEEKPEAPAPTTDTATPAPTPAPATTTEKVVSSGKPYDSTAICAFLLNAVNTLRENNTIPKEFQTYLERKIKQQQVLDTVYNQLHNAAEEESKKSSWSEDDKNTCERLMAKITGR